MKVQLLLLCTLLFITGSCQSQASGRLHQDDTLPLDPAVRYGKLENGFTYYLRRTDSGEKAVRFGLVIKAGWDHEDNVQPEYAHLLEHLLARETKNFPDLKGRFRQSGRRFHAFTKTRNTEYFTVIPKNDKQLFKDGLLLLEDWAQGNEWEPKSITVERAAVEGEMRTDDPYRKWKSTNIQKEIFDKMNYRPYDSQMKLESLRNFNSPAFYRFYKDWYRPDLQAAIIVGDINVDSLEKVIQERFGVLKGPPNPPDPKKYLDAQRVNFNEKVHFSTVIDSLEQGVRLEIFKVRPNLELNPKSRVDYRNMLVQQLYMILLNTRAQHLKEKFNPPFSHFWANYRSGDLAGKQINATQMRLELQSDDLETLKKVFQRGIKAWKQLHLNLDTEELAEIKQKVADNYQKPQSIKKFSERFQDHFVYGKAAPDPEVEANLTKTLLKEISIEDLENFMKEKGSLDKNSHFIFFKGKNIKLPANDVFKQWIKEIDTMQLKPLKAPAPPIQTLEDVITLSTSFTMKDVEVERSVIGVSTVKLPNGITLVLKPTPPSMDLYENMVSIQAFRPNLVPLDNHKEYLAAQAAPEVMNFSGAGPYSNFQLKRFIKEKQMNLHLDINKDNQLIFGNSKAEDLSEFFNLLYLYIVHPRQDQHSFRVWKDYKKNELEGKGIRGSAAFITEEITQLWYPEVPAIELNNLEQLKADHIYRAAQQWFSSLEDYTFIFTGDFETEIVLPVLINKFSLFPSKKDQITASTERLEFPLKKMQENLKFKNIDAAYIRLFFPVKVQKDLKTQIELKFLSLALHKSIRSRLREGSYAPIATGEWLDVENGIFALKIEFDSRLGEEEKMIAWALEEFRKLRENGIDEEWLKTAITDEIMNFEKGLESFHYYNFWQDYLLRKLINEEILEEEVLQYGTILKHFLNFEDLNSAAKKYLKENSFQQFTGFPEGYQNF